MDSPTLSPIVGHPKRRLAVEALARLAERLGPGAKLPRVADMALDLGIAVGTLDQCLRKLEEKGVVTRRRGSGIYVAPSVHARRVALVFGADIFSSAGSPVYSLLLQHCQRQAARRHSRFSFYLDVALPAEEGRVVPDACPLHEDLAAALADRRIDGIILVAGQTPRQEAWLRKHGVPMVRFCGAPDGQPGLVALDYAELIGYGLKSLAAQGCRTVGFLGLQREQAALFRDLAGRAGLATRDSWIVHPAGDAPIPEESCHKLGRDFALELLMNNGWAPESGAAPELPDGIVSSDDMLTRGLCLFLGRLGFAVGDTMKIASHSNRGSSALEEWRQRISMIEFDPGDMVAALFSALETLMDGRPLPARALRIPPRSPLA